MFGHHSGAAVIREIPKILFAKCDFSHIWPRAEPGTVSGIKAFVTRPAATAGSIQFELFNQSGNSRLLRLCAQGKPWERAMSEIEFDRLLETVRMAIEPTP